MAPNTSSLTVSREALMARLIANRIVDAYAAESNRAFIAGRPLPDSEIEAIVTASLRGHEHLRERVLRILEAGA